jgi:hypothetical protein
MEKYFVLISKDVPGRRGNDPEWPKIIAYSPFLRRFLFLEGSGHSLMGGVLREETAGQDKWRVIFKELRAEWILSFLKDNDGLDSEELLRTLEEKLGRLEVINY